jgi:hypothetical protein
VTGFVPLNITAADTLRYEPTEELLHAQLPDLARRAPLPGNASGWSIERARDMIGYVPQYSWRDEE